MDNLVNYNESSKKTYIIAEAGVNHNGDLKIAKRLIDVAKESRADAVKFQTFKAEDIVSLRTPKAQYQIDNTGSSESQYDMIKSLEFAENDFYELKKYSDMKEITFLSTPFDHKSVDFLDKIGVPLFKISSGDITNIPFLEHVGRKKKPVILSTGMSTLGEIEEAINALKRGGASDITLLHCTTSYPAPFTSINLTAINTLKCAFKLPVGYSDHSEGIIIPVAAAALGATVIEKHFTVDRNMPGPDHKASLNPEDLNEMIKSIRNVEIALGSGIKKPTEEEKENIKAARKSLVAKKKINCGELFSEDNIAIKRPGTGIHPKFFSEFLGRKADVAIEKDELIKWAHLNNR